MHRLAARFPALGSRDFRVFWLGQFISRVGSDLQGTALNWHVYELTGSPVALGALGLIRFIPVVLLSLVGGALADAVDRRRLMVFTQGILMVNAGVLGWLTYTDRVSVGAIYVLTVISAGAAAFDNPARQSLVANLVPRHYLANALSLSSAFFKIATIIGPMVAGLLIDAGGIAFTYWINSISFFGVITALLALRTGGLKGDSTPVTVQSLREGWQFVFQTPIILGMMVLDATATFFSAANALLPVFAKDVLQVGARGFGILSAAPAVGSMAAAGALALRPTIRRQGMVVLVAVAVHGLATVGFGLSKSFLLTCVLLAVANGADTVSAIMRQTIRQLVTPDRLRGRVAAFNMVFVMGGPRLGEMRSGLVAGWLGAPLSVVTGGIGCLLTVAAVAWKSAAVRGYVMKENERANP